jgi:hypothetical protein
MKKNYYSKKLKNTFFILIFLSSIITYSQTNITFDLGLVNNAQLGLTEDISGFNFTINGGAGDDIIFDDGSGSPNGSNSLYDDNLDIGGITMWTIKSIDGSEFQLMSIYLQEPGVGASASGTISAFKNGVQVGTTDAINFDGTKTFSTNPDFDDIDEFRIEATDINFFLDNLTYNTPVLSIDDISRENIISFYNSDTKELRIKGIENGKTYLQLFSINGKQLLSKEFVANNEVSISLPDFSTGIYILKLRTNEGYLNKKLFIK